MRTLFLLLALAFLPRAHAWESARPGWRYEFPRDHGAHPGFKTEWWYFTGNVRDVRSGRELGYELTFFRQGIRAPGERGLVGAAPRSRFATDEFRFAHLAVSDLTGGDTFHYDAKQSRGAFGEAGSEDPGVPGSRLAWMDDWTLTAQADGTWRIAARAAKIGLELVLRSTKPPVIHGEDGVSQKSPGEGNASHYYSFTRLETAGRISLEGKVLEVQGTSWFDHEWASNQLGADQVGWDWFCVQFDDGTELMLYGLRQRDGTYTATSSGTLVDAAGNTTHVRPGEFQMRPLARWKSPRTKGDYPVAWEVSLPAHGLALRLETPLRAQELALGAVNYWEGAIRVNGTRAGRPVKGVGYMELTGYAGELGALR